MKKRLKLSTQPFDTDKEAQATPQHQNDGCFFCLLLRQLLQLHEHAQMILPSRHTGDQDLLCSLSAADLEHFLVFFTSRLPHNALFLNVWLTWRQNLPSPPCTASPERRVLRDPGRPSRPHQRARGVGTLLNHVAPTALSKLAAPT